jgi:hypothetical protein
MSEEQWLGVLILAIGLYLLICSLWARNFVLYRLKVQRAAGVFGESAAHRLYMVLGVIMIGAGVAKASGVF